MDLGSLRRFLPGGRSKPSSDGAPAATAGVSVWERPPVPAWRQLPGLTPTVGPAPLVARSRGYEQELAGGRGTQLALQRLTHDRGLDAPRGLVTAATAPVSRLPSEPMPTSARRGRGGRTSGSAVVARTTSDTWSAADADDTSSPSDEPHLDPFPPAAVSAPSAPLAADVAQPMRHASSQEALPAPVVARQVGTGPSLTQSAQVQNSPTGIIGDRAVGIARSHADDPGSPDAARSSALDGSQADGPGVVARSASPRETGSSGFVTVPRSVGATTSMPEPSLAVSRTVGRVRRVRFDPPIGATTRPSDPPGATPVLARDVDAAAASPTEPRDQGPSSPSIPSAALPVGLTADAAALPAVPIRPVIARAVDQATGPLVGTLRPTSDPSSPAVAVGRAAGESAGEAPGEPGSPSAALAALSRIDPYGSLGGGFAPGFAPASPGWAGIGSGAGPVAQRSMPHPADSPTALIAGRQVGGGPAGAGLPDPGSTSIFGPVSVARTVGEGAGTEGFEPGGMPDRVAARSREATNRSLPAAFGGRPTVLRLAAASRAGSAAAGPSVGTTSPWLGSTRPSSGSVGSVRGVGSVKAADRVGSATPLDSVPPPAFMSSIPTIQGSFTTPDGPAAGTSWSMADGPGSAETAAGPESLGTMIQRSLEGSAVSSSAEVQRAPGDTAPAAAGGGASGSGGAGAGSSARELDELAKKLYEPLRRRLHRELLVDREREGSLLNLGR